MTLTNITPDGLECDIAVDDEKKAQYHLIVEHIQTDDNILLESEKSLLSKGSLIFSLLEDQSGKKVKIASLIADTYGTMNNVYRVENIVATMEDKSEKAQIS